MLGRKIEFWVLDHLADASPRCLQDCISIFTIQAGCSNFRLEVSPLVANGILKNGLSLGSEFRHPEHAVQRLRSESRIMLGSKIQCEFVS